MRRARRVARLRARSRALVRRRRRPTPHELHGILLRGAPGRETRDRGRAASLGRLALMIGEAALGHDSARRALRRCGETKPAVRCREESRPRSPARLAAGDIARPPASAAQRLRTTARENQRGARRCAAPPSARRAAAVRPSPDRVGAPQRSDGLAQGSAWQRPAIAEARTRRRATTLDVPREPVVLEAVVEHQHLGAEGRRPRAARPRRDRDPRAPGTPGAWAASSSGSSPALRRRARR